MILALLSRFKWACPKNKYLIFTDYRPMDDNLLNMDIKSMLKLSNKYNHHTQIFNTD